MFSIQILIVFMIISALIAIEAKTAFASVIALGVLGLELSLTFLLLKAPDIAVISLVMEMAALAAFAKAISGKTAENKSIHAHRDIFSTLTFIAFAVLFVIVLVKVFCELPVFGMPLTGLADLYSVRSIEDTAAANIVSAVTLGFRVFDTLIAVIILFLTAMGIFHLTGNKK